MDRMIRREPECNPTPAQPPVTTTYAPTFFRNMPIKFNFMNSPHFTTIPVSSSTVEPTLFNHASTSHTAPVETTPVETVPNTAPVETVPKTAPVETSPKPTHVETTTTNPLPSPIQPTTTPSTPTEPVIPLPQTVSIQELDFVLGLSPTNPSLTPFEHNEDPFDPQNTPVTQTPPPSPHSTQPFMPSPNQPTSPLHSGTYDYYEGVHSAHHSPEHSSPHLEQEREEVDTGASLRKRMPRKKRMSRIETRSSKRRKEDSERSEAEERGSRRRKRSEQQFEEGPGIFLKPKHLFSTPLARKTYLQFSEKVGVVQKGFSQQLLLANPDIKARIDSLGWETLCDTPNQYNLSWVREFDTEVAVTDGVELRVRKTPVSYSPNAINDLLELIPPSYSKLDRLTAGCTDEELDLILAKVANEGVVWSFKGRARLLKTQYLKPEANIWCYFMRHTIHPMSHDTNLCLERVLILYCILEARPFDVGRMICSNIKACVERTNGKLLYPSLIHRLMQKAQVLALPKDVMSMEKTSIDKKNLDRLMRVNANVQPDAPTSSMAALKDELLKAMEDHINALKRTIVKKHYKLMKRVDDLKKEVDLLKRERVQWAEYKIQKERTLRAASKHGKSKKILKLPPPPKSILLQHSDSPTQSE
ncbi:formin-like protein 3 [Cynara cardunculus var. scolymus]|uniref:formin-like protein 3 n=1 Tax=Cynara cardunculus var. scolymus TaxID=59895 RepID=UPI000D62D83D|nr:formin-like protein 3 [Cynara cardunculus var. scolymus]